MPISGSICIRVTDSTGSTATDMYHSVASDDDNAQIRTRRVGGDQSSYSIFGFMTDQEEIRRFLAARDKIIQLEDRERHGIGMQSEKTVHAILKNTKDPDESHQEVSVGRYIADICNGDEVIEIQSAGFGRMWPKLEAFLADYKVTIVYPIPHIKYITWIDPETGELLQRNRSHHTGTFYHAFKEMGKIRSLLTHPGLTINPMLIDMEEYRLLDGWSHDRKRGSHRYDRIPMSIYDEVYLHAAEDYAMFVPEPLRSRELTEPFTAKEFGALVGIREKAVSYSNILLVLTELGVVERVGITNRRAFLYRYAL